MRAPFLRQGGGLLIAGGDVQLTSCDIYSNEAFGVSTCAKTRARHQNPSTCHFPEVSPIAPMAALSLNALKASAIPAAGHRLLHREWHRLHHQLQHLLERGELREHTPPKPEHSPNPSTCSFLEFSFIAPLDALSEKLPKASTSESKHLPSLGRAAASTFPAPARRSR